MNAIIFTVLFNINESFHLTKIVPYSIISIWNYFAWKGSNNILIKKTNGGLCFTKDIDGKITAITAQADGNRSKSLSLKTMYKGIKRRNDTQATNAQKEPKP